MSTHLKKHINKELIFKELCQLLKPKLTSVENAMEYVNIGECGLALEFISDWCTDEEPPITLTTHEVLKIKEVGQLVNKNNLWIELLPILDNSEFIFFPKEQLKNVHSYLEKELITNSNRKEWISKIHMTIEKINN